MNCWYFTDAIYGFGFDTAAATVVQLPASSSTYGPTAPAAAAATSTTAAAAADANVLAVDDGYRTNADITGTIEQLGAVSLLSLVFFGGGFTVGKSLLIRNI